PDGDRRSANEARANGWARRLGRRPLVACWRMRAVILAGGLGTRLRPYTTIIHKPLVPVGDRPILEHIMGRLAHSGVQKIDLCVSHLGELIQLYFSQEGILPDGLELDWHWEDEPQGTAGALRTVADLD